MPGLRRTDPGSAGVPFLAILQPRRGAAIAWTLAAATVGLGSSTLFSSLLRLERASFVSPMSGWRTPGATVELSVPLRSGTYLVVNGGGNKLINAHYKTLGGERFRPWRGQSYGVDMGKLNGLGLRARGLLPKRLTAYEIFGELLYAPCAGEVMIAKDGVEEMTPPEMDRQSVAGNHVILKCSGAWVVLGHLQKGSVQVRTGQRVAEDLRVGRVGNTGNTGGAAPPHPCAMAWA